MNAPHLTSMRLAGIAGFLFFLVKGLIWLFLLTLAAMA